MSYFGLALALAGLNWLAIARNQKWLEYVTKPAVILALLAWLWLTIGLRGALPWFALGLLFSLIGDVLLMLPRERFLGGLAAFLLAQLAYIVGFNSSLPPITLAGVLLAALVGLGASAIYRRIRGGIPAKLKLPVGAYLCVISLMALSALLTLTNPAWAVGLALLASSGALLFFVSDSLIAWHRFVAPVPQRDVLVMVTYHLGQIALIVGAGLHYG